MKTKLFLLSLITIVALNQKVNAQADSTGTANETQTSVVATSDNTSTNNTQQMNVNNSQQFQTLFGSGKKGFGGYLGLISHYTEFNDQGAVLFGAELSTVINHSFNIGVKGYGSITKIKSDRLSNYGEQLYIAVGYGGLNFEPVLYYNSAVHLSFPVLIGGGAITEYGPYYYNYPHSYYHDYDYNYDYFFVFEPGISMELNLLKFMKLSTGASYRVTSTVDVPGYDSNDLNGFNFDLSLKFGWF